MPWRGGLDFKLQCAKFHHTAVFIVIERDRDTGKVYPDPVDGRCRIEYTASQFDCKNIVEGVIGAAKIAYAAGAREIFSLQAQGERFVRKELLASDSEIEKQEDSFADGINDPAFQIWLDDVRRMGLRSPDPCTLGSAHQMGTCRMSASPDMGVVAPKGRVWGTKNLYVADASVFSSASGVNPMVTNMGIADWISRGISKDLKREEKAQ